MEIIDIFTRMDEWRHLPDWQLERRADLFFSFYLKEVIEQKFNVTLQDTIIPEFPLQISPEGNDMQTNQTNKVDYAVFSDEDVPKCYLIELKTDMKSVNKKQQKYLIEAKGKKIETLVNDLELVFESTDEQRKYLNLFEAMQKVGLVKFKSQQNGIINFNKYSTWAQVFKDIKVLTNKNNPTVVYIQPLPDNDKLGEKKPFEKITFIEFADATAN
jgi:hypothetical protein